MGLSFSVFVIAKTLNLSEGVRPGCFYLTSLDLTDDCLMLFGFVSHGNPWPDI